MINDESTRKTNPGFLLCDEIYINKWLSFLLLQGIENGLAAKFVTLTKCKPSHKNTVMSELRDLL